MADRYTRVAGKVAPMLSRRISGSRTTIINNYITQTGGGGGAPVDLSWVVPQSRVLTALGAVRIDGVSSADLSADRSLALAIDSAGGLEEVANQLRVKKPASSGLVRNSNGMALNLDASGGVELSSDALRVKLDSPSYLNRVANGLSVAAHPIVALHSVTGAALDLVGATALNTLGMITPSANPGAASAILKSDASGFLELVRLIASNRVRTPLLDTASGNMTLTPAGGTVVVSGSASVGEDLTVDGTALVVDGSENAIGVNVVPDGTASLDVRAGFTSDHSVRIKQIASQTGRLWRVENSSGQELIVLDSVGNLQSGNPGFVSGLTGWRMTPTGNLEANNGRFRGELHASVFVFDEIAVENGTKLVTVHGGALHLDITLVATATVGPREVESTAFVDQAYLNVESTAFAEVRLDEETVENRLHVKNPDTGHYKLFSQGEVLRMKVWTGSAITDTWMKVNSAMDEGDHWSYAVTVVSGSLPVTYTEGSAIAGYGQPGDGAIRISADDDYGPLIDIFTTGNEPWNGQIYPHVRMGRLDGVGVPGVSGIKQWGLVAGANLADANSPYAVLSNLMQYMYKVKSEWHDGINITGRIEATGRVRFGTNVDNPANTFMDINPALGLATFRGAVEVLSGALTGVDLDLIPNGATYSRVNTTLLSGGNIRVGTGTKDSNLAGWHIDATEIVGQAGTGVDQVVMGTNGKIGFGAGAGLLDAAGIRLDTDSGSYDSLAAYKIYRKTSGVMIGKLSGWGSTGQRILELASPYQSGADSAVWLTADAPSGKTATIMLWTLIDTGDKTWVRVSATDNSISFATQNTLRAKVYDDGFEADNLVNVETTAW